MAECLGFAHAVYVHKHHVQNNSNRINGIIRGKFVLLCLPGRSKKRTLFQDISGGMVSDHTGGYVFSGLELFEIYIPKKFLEMEERRKKKSILVENAEFIIHEYLMKMIKK